MGKIFNFTGSSDLQTSGLSIYIGARLSNATASHVISRLQDCLFK